MLTRPTPASWEIFWAMRVSARSSTVVMRQAGGTDRQGDHRRVGGIDLGVDRRRAAGWRQQAAAGIDRRLHFLFGDVQAEAEIELQRDDRGAGRGDRRHFLQARHLAELAFQDAR